MTLELSTLMGDSLLVDWVFRSFVVIVRDVDTHSDLTILYIMGYDLILCIEWLSYYHKVMDCFVKTVTLAMLGIPLFMW